MVTVMLRRHYPDFTSLLNNIPDHRKRSTYQVAELIMAGLSMFIFKRGSRHNTNQSVRGGFEDNYVTLFGLRLPVMDTVDDFLRALPTENLERIKEVMVSELIKKRVLDKYRFNGYHSVAVDGSGLMSFTEEPFEGCPYKTNKKGKKTYSAYVLEAKILCENGLSISIATEWYSNAENIKDKQDCELNAFKRLAEKIKQKFPRLPILLLADSLYPNDPVFELCRQYQWQFIFTFKDTVLKSVWKKINHSIKDSQIKALDHQNDHWGYLQTPVKKAKQGYLYESICYINDIKYKSHLLHWVEYQIGVQGEEPQERFTHISSIRLTETNAYQISQRGRLRWKIENEGFNTQKNQGYGLQHKYSRKHLGAMQNYYQLLQIAHLINQLTEKLQKVKQAIMEAKTTLKALWDDLIGSLQKELFHIEELETAFCQTSQLRY